MVGAERCFDETKRLQSVRAEMEVKGVDDDDDDLGETMLGKREGVQAVGLIAGMVFSGKSVNATGRAELNHHHMP